METEPVPQDFDEVIQSGLNFYCEDNSSENNNSEDTSSNDLALQFTTVTFKSISQSTITSMSFNLTFKR